MRRRYLWAGVIAAVVLMFSGATWYIGYANTTHPAPWPMAGGDAGHRHRAGAAMPGQVSLQWTFRLPDTASPTPPVVGEDGTVYVANGSLFAVSPEGEQQWVWGSQTPIYSIALGRQGEVYAQAADGLYAFTATGQMKWKYPMEMGPSFPIVVGQGGIIYTAGREYLYAITDDGKLKWRFKGQRLSSGPVETPRGQILITIDETLYSLSRDGDDIWRIPVKGLGGYMPITALEDGRILVKADALYISEPDGTLLADQQVDSTVVSNIAAGRDFMQYGYTRFDLKGVKTLSMPGVQGAKEFGTVVDDRGNSLIVSPVRMGGRFPVRAMAQNTFFGLAMLDGEGREVWTYRTHPPIVSGVAVAGDRIYYVGMDAKNGSMGLIALGNP